MNAPFRSSPLRRAGLGLLAAAAVGGVASAAPVKATIRYPTGFTPGRPSVVRVELAPTEENEAARRAFDALKGTSVALLLEGGQYGASREVALGKIGGALQARVRPDSPGPHRLGLRFVQGGRLWGEVADIELPARPGELELTLEEPITRRSVPLGQVALWVGGASLVGLLALRGVGAF